MNIKTLGVPVKGNDLASLSSVRFFLEFKLLLHTRPWNNFLANFLIIYNIIKIPLEFGTNIRFWYYPISTISEIY